MCFEQGYRDLIDKANKDATYIVKETIEGDRVLSQMCKVLKSKVWPNDVSNVEEVTMKMQFSSVETIYDQYCQMLIFQGTSFQQGRLSSSCTIRITFSPSI